MTKLVDVINLARLVIHKIVVYNVKRDSFKMDHSVAVLDRARLVHLTHGGNHIVHLVLMVISLNIENQVQVIYTMKPHA
jgi:hypothetical protein